MGPLKDVQGYRLILGALLRESRMLVSKVSFESNVSNASLVQLQV